MSTRQQRETALQREVRTAITRASHALRGDRLEVASAFIQDLAAQFCSMDRDAGVAYLRALADAIAVQGFPGEHAADLAFNLAEKRLFESIARQAEEMRNEPIKRPN